MSSDLIPKERYLSREFLDLEYERLWSRVWQVACREEEVPNAGDYVEYTIGDESVIVVRSAPGAITALPNACLHRGTRLADGAGHVADGAFRCPFHAWRYALDGRVVEVVDADDFPGSPTTSRCARCGRSAGAASCSSTSTPTPSRCSTSSIRSRSSSTPYHLDQMRFRSYLTTVLPANWKVVVDAFNEAYHVQTGHEQILPWTDDMSIVYEQLGNHAHYGRLPGARRELRPSPRLGLTDDEFDEGEMLAGMVAGLGGAFLGDEAAIVAELRASDLPDDELLGGVPGAAHGAAWRRAASTCRVSSPIR